MSLPINQIICGDCLEVMQEFPDNSIDLVVTSPPYDSLRDYHGYSFDFEGIAQQLFRVTKPGGVVVWVVADATVNGSETGTSFKQALYFKEFGFNLHDTIIWEKQTFTATGALRTRYAQVFEYMFVLSKGKVTTFSPIKDRSTKGIRKKHGTVRQSDGTTRKQSSIGKIYSDTEAQRFNIWRINTECSNINRCHPAQFPGQLACDHIYSWSNEDDIVLDPFVGSGTTCLAALKLNRKYIGIDISQEYCDLANQRIKEQVIQRNIFE